MRIAIARRAAPAMLVLGFVACDRQAPPPPDAAVPIEDVVAIDVQPTIDELRATHDVHATEGASCADDRSCTSPLRCQDAQCSFPPAMTGAFPADAPTVTFDAPRGATYRLEVARNPWEMTRGLMDRRYLVADAGMVFAFGTDAPRSFWMRNTLIPLDMVFVTATGVVDSFVQNAEPLTETPRRSAGPARFVIELRGGEVARMGLQAGSQVTLRGVD